MTVEVAPDIWRIVVATPWPVGPVNVYVLDDDPLTLIDTPQRSDAAPAELEHGLALLGRRVEDLQRIVAAEAVTSEPRTAAAIAAELKGSLSDRTAFFVLCEVLGHLDELIDAGAVAGHVDGDGVSRFATA